MFIIILLLLFTFIFDAISNFLLHWKEGAKDLNQSSQIQNTHLSLAYRLSLIIQRKITNH